MASKADEAKAWKKLLSVYPTKHRQLTCEYKIYTHLPSGKQISIEYRAYVEDNKPYGWGEYFKTPMEAVNDVIGKEVQNATTD